MFFHSKTVFAFSKTSIFFYFSFYSKGQFCQTYVCEDYCLHGGTPTGNWEDDHYQCHCDCPPGTSGPRCEKDACTTLSCKNGGRCVVLDTREICNCSLEYTGTLNLIKHSSGHVTNPILCSISVLAFFFF